MTANQIAYASEQEQERHNRESENYNLKLLKLNQEIADETVRHNQVTENITKDYNDRYLAWQEAQGTTKLAIEEELKNLTAMRDSYNREYQQQMMILEDRKLDIENQKRQDTKWFNEQTVWLQGEANRINRYRWDNEFSLRNQELVFRMGAEFEQRKYEFEENLGVALRNQLLSGWNLEQKKTEWRDTRLLRAAQVFNTVAGGIGNIFNSASGTTRVIPFSLHY